MDNSKYINRTFEKNKNIIKKLKKIKINNFEYNFSHSNKINNKKLEYIFKILNKKNLTLNDLNNINGDYKSGVLPYILILCHYTYYFKYIEKSFFNFNILYRDSELYVGRYNNNLFISLRGTNIYSQIEYFHDLSFYKKNINYINEFHYNKFLKWKNKLLKTYPIEKILSRKIISNNFRFHGGFIDLYNAYNIYSKIKSILINNKNFKKILICGHSMGGSFTNLLILDLLNFSHEYNRKLNIKAVTFGAPGCMNSNLSLFYFYLSSINFVTKYIRIHNNDDVISSTFSNQDDYFTMLIGLLRHINSAVLDKDKNIIKKNNYDCSKRFIVYNTQKNINRFSEKKFNYVDIHNIFCFSSSKKAVLFSL